MHSEITASEEAHYQFAVSFPVQCDSQETLNKIKHELKKRAIKATSNIDCLQIGTCSLQEPKITGCPSYTGRYKRDAEPSTIDIKVGITYRGEITTSSKAG